MKDKIFPPGTALSAVMSQVQSITQTSFNEVEDRIARFRQKYGDNDVIPKDALPEARQLRKDLQNEINDKTSELNRTKRIRDDVLDMDEAFGMKLTLENDDGRILNLKVQKNDCSRLHKLSQAMEENTISWPISSDKESYIGSLSTKVQSFVVDYDWSTVLGEEAQTGDFQLPFELCAFEFRVNERTVVALTVENSDKFGMMVFYETKTGNWMNIGDLAVKFWTKLIRSICVMLEAEVAVREVKRVPHKLAAKRAAAGKLPMYDFHTLSLAKRFRTPKGAPGNATGAHKRLHFVRGHWRHYEEHKTWIKWHLRGDETLGFADKNYKV